MSVYVCDEGQAMQLVQQDPVSCCGMAAGWIFVDEAKCLMTHLTSSVCDKVQVSHLLSRVVDAYRFAIKQFLVDETQDGPYGYNFAAVKLVSILMACDDMLLLVKRKELYQEENLITAQQLIDDVNSSQVVCVSKDLIVGLNCCIVCFKTIHWTQFLKVGFKTIYWT